MEGFRELVSSAQSSIARGLRWAAITTREGLSLWTWDSLHSSRFFDILLADQIGYAPLNEEHDTVYDRTHNEPPAYIR